MGALDPCWRAKAGIQALTIPARSRLHGRRKGRPLNKRKTALMRDLLPRLEIKVRSSVCEPHESINANNPTILEIGFGGGEHLAAQAARHPNTNFIGCEPFINGIAGLLDHIDSQKLTNIRIFPDDARLLLQALPDASLDACFILYPDPWPKKRHAERRLINPETLDLLARTMKPNAELRLATDVEPLADWMQKQIEAHPAFTMFHDNPTPPPDWIQTRYEHKGIIAARTPHYLLARRQ